MDLASPAVSGTSVYASGLSVEVFRGFNESTFSRITAEMSSSPCVYLLLDSVAQLLMHSLQGSYEYYCEHSILIFWPVSNIDIGDIKVCGC